MRAGDFSKAEECFREAVSLDQKHAPSILLAAAIAWTDEQLDVARNLFEVATHYQPDSVTWAVRALFHMQLDDDSIAVSGPTFEPAAASLLFSLALDALLCRHARPSIWCCYCERGTLIGDVVFTWAVP
jgi:tetratricopeptide (TPR) repeat protein